MVGDAMGSFRRDRENGRIAGAVPVFDMVGCEWTVELVLRDAVRIFAWMAERALVEIRRPAATDVQHDKANSPADRRIGAVARSESVRAAVHTDFGGDRSVDDDERRGDVGGCLDAVQI